MDIITKPKHNTIFWRNSEDESWEQANLNELIHAYEKDSCTLKYGTTVYTLKGRELYSMFCCDKCDEVITTLDKEHDLVYCPYCGRRIIR